MNMGLSDLLKKKIKDLSESASQKISKALDDLTTKTPSPQSDHQKSSLQEDLDLPLSIDVNDLKKEAIEMNNLTNGSSGSEGKFALGMKYFTGNGVKQDYKAAYDIFKSMLLFGEGYEPARLMLAICNLNGYGCEQDVDTAIETLEKLVRQPNPNPEAAITLARVYNSGAFTMRMRSSKGTWTERLFDKRKAKKYYEIAVKQDNPQAKAELGAILLQENLYKEGIELINEAAQSGVPDALVSLGQLYMYGQIVKQDTGLAERYLKKAIQQNCATAFNTYSKLCRMLGRDKEAFEYLKKAADANDPFGVYDLAYSYMAGKIVPRDLNYAQTLLKKAHEMNVMRATFDPSPNPIVPWVFQFKEVFGNQGVFGKSMPGHIRIQVYSKSEFPDEAEIREGFFIDYQDCPIDCSPNNFYYEKNCLIKGTAF